MLRRAIATVCAAALLYAAPAQALTASQRVVLLSGVQGWSFPGSSVDLNFARNAGSCTVARILKPCTSLISTTRTTTGGTASGLVPASASGAPIPTYANNTLRIVPGFGLLPELAHHNYLLASTAPATQTTGSLATGAYTLWVNGSGSAQMSAGTATGCGTGTASQGSPVTFTLTVLGTCTVTVTGSLNAFQINEGSFGLSLCVTTVSVCSQGSDIYTLIGAALTAALNAKAAFFQTNGVAGGTTPFMLQYAGGPTNFFYASSTTSRIQVGANLAQATLGSGSYTGVVKSAFGYEASGMTAIANGGTKATNANPPSVSGSIYLGSTNGLTPLNGFMLRAAFGPTKGQFDGYTTP